MLFVINPIAWTIINTHLRNAFTHSFDITRIACS